MTPRVVVLSLAYRPNPGVQRYVRDLVAAGVDVDLLVAESSSLDDVTLDPRVRVARVLSAEADHPLRKWERRLVFGVPARLVRGVGRVTGRTGLLERAQQKVSRGVHYRLFWPAFRFVRPWLLARESRRPLARFDLAHADRIVAADYPAIPLGWRLARKYPEIRATTALDRKPYVGD